MQQVKALSADVSRFGSSITGSDAYWQKKKSELVQIVEQGGASYILHAFICRSLLAGFAQTYGHSAQQLLETENLVFSRNRLHVEL
jgi:hypothetical protein